MEKIRKIVERHFKVNLASKDRKFIHVFARGCYYKICRDVEKKSYQKIADTMGKNHATVLHGIKMVKNLTETDKELKHSYQTLLNKFNYYNKIEQEMSLTELLTAYNKLLIECDEKDKTIEKLNLKIKELEKAIDTIYEYD